MNANWKIVENKDWDGVLHSTRCEYTKPGFVVSIVRGHIYHKNHLVMHCFKLGIDTRTLTANTFEDAVTEAALIVQDAIKALSIAAKGMT